MINYATKIILLQGKLNIKYSKTNFKDLNYDGRNSLLKDTGVMKNEIALQILEFNKLILTRTNILRGFNDSLMERVVNREVYEKDLTMKDVTKGCFYTLFQG